jgi:hypothetical protein
MCKEFKNGECILCGRPQGFIRIPIPIGPIESPPLYEDSNIDILGDIMKKIIKLLEEKPVKFDLISEYHPLEVEKKDV